MVVAIAGEKVLNVYLKESNEVSLLWSENYSKKNKVIIYSDYIRLYNI